MATTNLSDSTGYMVNKFEHVQGGGPGPCVQVEHVWRTGPYTVRSKLNTFEQVNGGWGRPGPCTGAGAGLVPFTETPPPPLTERLTWLKTLLSPLHWWVVMIQGTHIRKNCAVVSFMSDNNIIWWWKLLSILSFGGGRYVSPSQY